MTNLIAEPTEIEINPEETRVWFGEVAVVFDPHGRWQLVDDEGFPIEPVNYHLAGGPARVRQLVERATSAVA